MKRRHLSRIAVSVCMILALVLSLASCDLFAKKVEDIGGVKPHELYRVSSRKYRDAKENDATFSANITWTKATDTAFNQVIVLTYNSSDFYASLSNTSADGIKKESSVFSEGKFYFADEQGGKQIYDSTRKDVINYVENATALKNISPALLVDFPDSWFDGNKLKVEKDGTYRLTVKVDSAKSLAMREHSTFYVDGSQVDLYFGSDGTLNMMTLGGVKVNNEVSNITIEFDWSTDKKVNLPQNASDYQHKGFYSYAAGKLPGSYHDHSYSEWYGNTATCTLGGQETRKCIISGCDATETRNTEPLGHDEVQHEGKDATCSEDGYMPYVTCSRCDYTTYSVIVTEGHQMGRWTPTTAATCYDPGIEVSQCSVCDFTKTRNVAPLGHDTVTVPAKEPGCTEIGWEAYETCTRCDYNTKVEITGLHNLSSWKTIVPATCLEGGSEYRFCFLCEHREERDTSPLGHDMLDFTGNTATCLEGGKEFSYCSRCDYSESRDTVALGHDEIHKDGKAPTCTTVGWEEYVTCSRCTYNTYVRLEALGHAEVHYEGKPATCTEGGFKDYVTCERCDYTTYEALSALGHGYIKHEAKAATCTEIGWSAYETCSRCDYTTYSEKEALGHDMGSWYGNTATCTEDGVEYRNCSRCDHVETQPTVKYGHAEVQHEGKPATCTEGGFKDYVTCERCDYTTYEAIEALGHDEIRHEAKDYTCTESGWNEYVTCGRCDYSTYEEIPAAHRMGEWFISIQGSCTEAGERKQECSMCDHYVTEVVEAMHDEIHHEAQAPTCTEDGWGEYVTCSKCDYSTKSEVIIPACHTYGEWQHTDAGCTTCGSDFRICEACGHKEVIYTPANGHSYVDGVCEHCSKREDDYTLPSQPLT